MKICVASPSDVINNMELAVDTLKINCAKRRYYCTYQLNEDSSKLKGKVRTPIEQVEFVLRFIQSTSGLLHKKDDRYRLDVLASESNYDSIIATNPQNAIQRLLTAIERNVSTALVSESIDFLDEETDGYDADVFINKRNKPLRPTPVPIDGFEDDHSIDFTRNENLSSARKYKFETIDLVYGYGKALQLELDDTIKTGCFILISKKRLGYTVTVSDEGKYERETTSNNYVFDKQSKAKKYALDLAAWIDYAYDRGPEVKCPKPIDYI